MPAASLGARTLGDFGKFIPELLKIGLPANTKLVGNLAYSYRVKPGAVVLPEVGACGVSMEAWTKTKGGAPYVYDFSFGYGDVDFYAVREAHAVGERFMEAVFADQLYKLQPQGRREVGRLEGPLPDEPAAVSAAVPLAPFDSIQPGRPAPGLPARVRLPIYRGL